MDELSFTVQVCHAQPNRQFLQALQVDAETTIEQVIRQSGVLRQFPDIDLDHCRVGIYGKLKTLDATLRAGDRVEIYRPLIADPMDARRRRAGKRENRQTKAGA